MKRGPLSDRPLASKGCPKRDTAPHERYHHHHHHLSLSLGAMRFSTKYLGAVALCAVSSVTELHGNITRGRYKWSACLWCGGGEAWALTYYLRSVRGCYIAAPYQATQAIDRPYRPTDQRANQNTGATQPIKTHVARETRPLPSTKRREVAGDPQHTRTTHQSSIEKQPANPRQNNDITIATMENHTSSDAVS